MAAIPVAVRRAALYAESAGPHWLLGILSAIKAAALYRQSQAIAAPTCCHSLPLPPVASGCSVSGCRSYPEFGPPHTPCGCGARPHGLARGLQRLPLLLCVRCFGWWLVLSTVGSFVCVPLLLAAAGCGWPRAAGLLLPALLVLVWLLLSLRGWPSPPPLLVVPLSLLFALLGRCGAPRGRIWWRGVPPALRRSSARGGWPLSGLLVLLLVWWSPLPWRL